MVALECTLDGIGGGERLGWTLGWKRFERYGYVKCIGVLRCAQDDGKYNSKDNSKDDSKDKGKDNSKDNSKDKGKDKGKDKDKGKSKGGGSSLRSE